MISPDSLVAITIGLAAPISVAVFKLVPQRFKETSGEDERRHALANHDHNGKYITRNECQLVNRNMDTIFDGIGRDLHEIKTHLNEIDRIMRTK
jgi:hypothetical protein